jgi:tryptophan synthase alpha chain
MRYDLRIISRLPISPFDHLKFPMPKSHRSIAESFADVRGRKIGLVPFLPAGYPDLDTTAAMLAAVDAAGATAIEIGFPFSDPIADGPTIQHSFTAALTRKVKVSDIFSMIQKCAPQISAPMIGMLSYSIVFRHGPEKFFAEARSAGLAGLIIPDLPPPEANQVCTKIRAAGLDTILLVAPTTTPDRRREIAAMCSGFVYYLSVSGITGARENLPADLADNVRQLRAFTDRPICVGFGISKPNHLSALAGIADGAIVGSAIVKRVTELVSSSPALIAGEIGDYCRSLIL